MRSATSASMPTAPRVPDRVSHAHLLRSNVHLHLASLVRSVGTFAAFRRILLRSKHQSSSAFWFWVRFHWPVQHSLVEMFTDNYRSNKGTPADCRVRRY